MAKKIFQTDRPSAERLLDMGRMSAKVGHALGESVVVLREGPAAITAFGHLERLFQWSRTQGHINNRIAGNFAFYIVAHLRNTQIAREDLDKLSELAVKILTNHVPHFLPSNAKWLTELFVDTGLISEGMRQRILDNRSPGPQESWDGSLQEVLPFLQAPKRKKQQESVVEKSPKPIAPQPFYGTLGPRRILRRHLVHKT